MTALSSALASALAVTKPVRPRHFLPALVRTASVVLPNGSRSTYADFDVAATAPALVDVKLAVDAALPTYSSVHRGAGALSQISTRAFEDARRSIGESVGSRPDDAVIFTKSTTDSANLLAHCLPTDTRVLVFDTEHHATLLPWRGAEVHRLGVPTSPAAAVWAVRAELARISAGPTLVCVTGASNVTGEVWPVKEIAAAAKDFGAKVYLDAAQLAPHRRIDLTDLDVDWLAFSGHKVYAPFGTGVLIGRTDWLADAPAYLAGGGASASVWETDLGYDVEWAPLPARHEAGTPNLLGAVAIAQALRTLRATGFDVIARHESELTAHLVAELSAVPDLRTHSLWGSASDRIGVVAFTIDGHTPRAIAEHLASDGIGVRDGAFCAHPFVRALIGCDGSHAVRASFGIGTTAADVRRLADSLRRLVEATYQR